MKDKPLKPYLTVKLDKPDTQVFFRCTTSDKSWWVSQSQTRRMKLTAWIINRLGHRPEVLPGILTVNDFRFGDIVQWTGKYLSNGPGLMVVIAVQPENGPGAIVCYAENELTPIVIDPESVIIISRIRG